MTAPAVGQRVKVLPAYDARTGRRDRVDEVAHCEGEVLSLDGSDARVRLTFVRLPATERVINIERLVPA